MQKPEAIVEMLKTIEEVVTAECTAANGTKSYGLAPNVVAERIFEKLVDKGFDEGIADRIADDAQSLVEYFVTSVNDELTYK